MSDGYALQVGIVLACLLGCGSGSSIFPQCGSGFRLAISVVDPQHIDADPDSTYHPDADPNSAFYLRIRIRIQILASKYRNHFDADPYSDFNLMWMRTRMQIQVTKMMRIPADPDPQSGLLSQHKLNFFFFNLYPVPNFFV
jgi:hypothetical protein